MEFDYGTMGKVIRSLRNERGLSQEVLSGLAGIARTHLSMIENGAIRANVETVWKLACALGLRPSELFTQVERELAKQ